MNIGNKIRKILKEKRMTQPQLAGRLGISVQSVKNAIGRGNNVNVPTMMSYAEALEVPLWYLCIDDDSEVQEFLTGEKVKQNDNTVYVCPVCGSELHTKGWKAPERQYKVTVLCSGEILGSYGDLYTAINRFNNALTKGHYDSFIYLEEQCITDDGRPIGWNTLKRGFSEK